MNTTCQNFVLTQSEAFTGLFVASAARIRMPSPNQEMSGLYLPPLVIRRIRTAAAQARTNAVLAEQRGDTHRARLYRQLAEVREGMVRRSGAAARRT